MYTFLTSACFYFEVLKVEVLELMVWRVYFLQVEVSGILVKSKVKRLMLQVVVMVLKMEMLVVVLM